MDHNQSPNSNMTSTHTQAGSNDLALTALSTAFRHMLKSQFLLPITTTLEHSRGIPICSTTRNRLLPSNNSQQPPHNSIHRTCLDNQQALLFHSMARLKQIS